MIDLESSLSTIPSGYIGIHAMKVLLKLLKDTKANYTTVDNDYDYWFNYYLKYIDRVVPKQISDFVSWSDKGPGNQYFDCTVHDADSQHQPKTYPAYSIAWSYNVDYDFNDEAGFWNALTERGI
jgi:hypothetical protein